MRTFNIITSKGTWQISGINLYEACKAADLRLVAKYPYIKIWAVTEDKPYKLNIQPEAWTAPVPTTWKD